MGFITGALERYRCGSSRAWVGAVVLLALAGCSSAPPVPTDHFYRLPAPAPTSVSLGKVLGEVAIVPPLRADGLHNERALLYADDPNGLRLKRYHYHLWLDNPPKLLQEQLAAHLRATEAADLIMTKSGPVPNYLVVGKIYRFEQAILAEGKSKVSVDLQLGVERAGEYKPFLVKRYARHGEVATQSVVEVVEVYGELVNDIFRAFVTDVSTHFRP
ncbi:MAG: ABC-type transport auxiliary lipoprotein family protein [Gammaproteobacteria bacterium]|nr:ABC-type transport auxiliary lipoprotein family protein [Gammaproteobacteria bacterium]